MPLLPSGGALWRARYETVTTEATPPAAAIEVSMVGADHKTYAATGFGVSTNSETVDVVGFKSFPSGFATLPAWPGPSIRC